MNFLSQIFFAWVVIMSFISLIYAEKVIVFGEEAKLGQFPSVVHISAFEGPISYSCGGTLITILFVLTAAHCVVKDNTVRTLRFPIYVEPGIVHLDSNHSRITSDGAFPHENFEKTKVEDPSYDIALIKLREGIELTSYINVATLPDSSPDSGSVTITGWGTTENRTSSSTLRYVSMTLASKEVCSEVINKIEPDSVLCVKEAPKGICFGDSGGPYFLKDSSIVVGVVSFGEADAKAHTCNTKSSSVGTNVHFYLNWINQTMETNKDA